MFDKHYWSGLCTVQFQSLNNVGRLLRGLDTGRWHMDGSMRGIPST